MHVFDLSTEYAVVPVRGASRLDFLHRMSTGALAGLQPGQGARTIFTTPIGRMVDVAVVLVRSSELWLVCSAAAREKLMRWLGKYVFFNDDVQFAAPDLQIAGVFGPGADAWADAIAPGAPGWALHAHADVRGITLARTHALDGAGWWCIGTAATLAPVVPSARESLDAYHALRVEAGYAAFPGEISEDFIPLEAGLWDAVSFSKGCYIGQEIIARMESRNQIARRLVRIEGAAAAVGDPVYADEHEVGAITSASRGGALGYVRAAAAVDGRLVAIGADKRPARVVAIARM